MPILCFTSKGMPSVLIQGQLSIPVVGQYIKLPWTDWMHSEGYQRARKSLRWEMCFADSILFIPKGGMTLDYTCFILNSRQ